MTIPYGSLALEKSCKSIGLPSENQRVDVGPGLKFRDSYSNYQIIKAVKSELHS